MQGVDTVFTDGIADISDYAIEMFATVLPYGLVIFGIIFAITFAVRIWNRTSDVKSEDR